MNSAKPVKSSARALAVHIISEVVLHKRSLTDVLARDLPAAHSETAFIKQLCFGTLRFYERLQWQLNRLLDKPLQDNQQVVRIILLIGLYQLQYSHMPSFAVVSTAVELTRDLRQAWAAGLVNAILRNFLRRQAELDERMQTAPEALHCHPTWLIKATQAAYPDAWPAILASNLQQAPLTLRVNQRRVTRSAYLVSLQAAGLEACATQHSAVGIHLLKGVPVHELPDFNNGYVSIQDEAAQLTAYLLDCAPGQRVLDACAAPGGKSAHLLETADIDLVALDIDAGRTQRIQDNLQRLQLQASVHIADANDVNRWWDGQSFDRILLDAPCSATGIIRRQPDIKLHRRLKDVQALVTCQTQLLHTLWSTLKPGGILLYATCSLLPQENQQVIQAFVDTHSDATWLPITWPLLSDTALGLSLLPGQDGMDGFFYAKLLKHE